MNRNILIIFISLVIIACKSPEGRSPIQHNSGTFINKSVERNKAIYDQEETQMLELLNSNPEQPYLVSESGFWYYYNKKDTLSTQKPTFGDHITFLYDVKLLDGTTILSEEEIGLQNYLVDKTNQELISGIRDGIKLMKQGEIVTFLFPSFKAYGYYGIEGKLGTNVPVKCKVTLKSIKH